MFTVCLFLSKGQDLWAPGLLMYGKTCTACFLRFTFTHTGKLLCKRVTFRICTTHEKSEPEDERYVVGLT